jgi:hypothetical protein
LNIHKFIKVQVSAKEITALHFTAHSRQVSGMKPGI